MIIFGLKYEIDTGLIFRENFTCMCCILGFRYWFNFVFFMSLLYFYWQIGFYET